MLIESFENSDMDNSFIAIAIPTFQRNKQVIERLYEISNSKYLNLIKVCIYDNEPNSKLVDLIKNEKLDKVKIIYKKNKCNQGASINLALAILEATTNSQYVWPISDDNEFNNAAIDKVIEMIKLNPESSAFCTSIYVNKALKTKSLLLFLKVVEDCKAFLFLGNYIYRSSDIIKFSNYAFEYNSFMCPHILYSIFFLKSNLQIKVTPLSVFNYKPLGKDHRQWSYIQGFRRLYEICNISQLSRKESNEIRKIFSRGMPKIYGSRSIFCILTALYSRSIREVSSDYVFNQLLAASLNARMPLLFILNYVFFYNSKSTDLLALILFKFAEITNQSDKLYRNSKPSI